MESAQTPGRRRLIALGGLGMAAWTVPGVFAQMLVETPRRMSAKQKKLLEEFRKTETGDECPASKSFFQRVRETFGT